MCCHRRDTTLGLVISKERVFLSRTQRGLPGEIRVVPDDQRRIDRSETCWLCEETSESAPTQSRLHSESQIH